MDAFKVKVNGKVLDYRLGQNLDLEELRKYFSQEFVVKKLWQGGRHVLGILENGQKSFFLKMATTEGISALTKVEAEWNEQFNKLSARETSMFWVPKIYVSGYFQERLFYLITDFFEGILLAERPDSNSISSLLEASLAEVVSLSEYIQHLPIKDLKKEEYIKANHYQQWFIEKTRAWYRAIPDQVISVYEIDKLLEIVVQGSITLEKKPRHGDFTPWHIMRMANGKLGLLDGEHAISDSVEYYDLAYFMQRVFSVLEKPRIAKEMLEMVLSRHYNLKKLQVVLAARGIGGFLDRSLQSSPDYSADIAFMEWVLGLSTR